ncbi:uncharacterized protein LOC114561845 [Perca flavescens]|uniref:uncharacterized protein LOC114561845 n=1 Tax=Perca flavescens TaxID=8167 RepID=UPI00106E377A|nr:uncharacterized protein LOC114561845 [Perca flavescens]XP_028443770.1 uncharacterized protein LOC114561845 [Perca flavescens]
MVLDLVYKYFKMWLWILIGLNIITKVHGFANGKFPQSCESLLPQHDGRTPMNSEPPFEMIVDQKGDTITVSLQSKQSTPFRGFMLDARQKGNRAVGKFILLEPDNTRLLTCNNFADTAVSQKNNRNKNKIRVNWAPQGEDVDIMDFITFRATFLEKFVTFWEPMDLNVNLTSPTTPSPTPSTTTSSPTLSTTTPSTTQPSIATASTTTSTTTPSTIQPSITTPSTTQPSTTTPSTTQPSSTQPGTTTPSTTKPSTTYTSDSDTTKPTTAETNMTTKGPHSCNLLQVNAIVGMNFVCFLVVVKTELPNILATTLHNSPLSCCLNKVLKILCSLLCVAVEITAVVLFCLADTIKVTLVALVCVAIVFDFIKLVIVCLPIGPSHELKEICDLMVNVCSVIHVIFTTTVVFVGVLEMDNCRNTKEDSWLLKVMVAYTIWILLFLIWVSVNSIQRKAILGRSQIGNQKHGKRWRKQKNMKLSAAEVMVTAVSVILIVGNLCFAVAVTVGIFRYQEM